MVVAHSFCPYISTYNLNSLSNYATAGWLLKRKLRMLANIRKLTLNNDIILLQETHLNPRDDAALKFSFPDWGFHYSNHPSGGKAGVLTMVSRRILNDYTIQQRSVTPSLDGHLLIIDLVHSEGKTDPFTVVNCYLPQDTLGKVHLLKTIKDLPFPKDVFLMGDFNFVEYQDDDSDPTNYKLPASLQREWELLVNKLDLSEIWQQAHTFLRRVQGKLVSSRLDRCYISRRYVDLALSPPSSFLPQVPFSILGRFQSEDSGTFLSSSDHSPLSIVFPPSSNPYPNTSLPRWVFETAEFKVRFQEELRDQNVTSISDPFAALAALKDIASQVAISVRFHLSMKSSQVNSVMAKSTIAITLLRKIIAGKDAAVRDTLLKFPFLESLVSHSDGGWDCVRLRESIDEWISAAATPQALLAADELRWGASFHPGPNKDSTSNQTLKDLKAFLPLDRARLPGLRRSIEDEISTEKEEMAAIAGEYYSKLWSKRIKPPGSPSPSDYFKKTGYKKVIPAEVTPIIPTSDIIINIIMSTNNSSPGPDGIPFSVYRSAPDVVAPILHAVVTLIGAGHSASEGFNHGILFLLLKKGTLLPADTRPLSVTNADNRIVAKIISYAIVPAVQSIINPVQKGFINGRNGEDHINSMMDKFYRPIKSGKGNYHVLQVDTRRAFDCIDHEFIMAALAAAGFPCWIINAVNALLQDVWVNPTLGGPTNTWIKIERGVKQGCPLSGIIFAICYDSLICDIIKKSPSTDVHAYADDLALGVIRRIHLCPAMRALDVYKVVSGLEQNIDKTNLTSSRSCRLSDELWVAGPICVWKGLKVTSSSTYLGVLYGRKVTTSDIFALATHKAIERLTRYYPHFRKISYSKRVIVVNVFIMPLLTYLCKYYPFPFHSGKGSSTTLYSRFRSALTRAVIPFYGNAFA